jgi:hypothetical protein
VRSKVTKSAGRQAARNSTKQRQRVVDSTQQDELPPDLWPDGKQKSFVFFFFFFPFFSPLNLSQPVPIFGVVCAAGVLFCSNWVGTHHPVRPGATLASLAGASVHFRFTFRRRRVWQVEKSIDGEFEYAFEYDYHPSGNLRRAIVTRAMLGVLVERFEDRVYDDAADAAANLQDDTD